MAEHSIHNQLKKEIKELPPGKLLFPTDFLEIGDGPSLLMAFSRMVREKILIRLAKGIYVKHQEDPYLGKILPSLDQIAKAIAEKEQVIIRPTGSQALNMLGLSTQVPTKVVYLTNGSRREIKVGKGVIIFKPTTPKKLAAKNFLIYLSIQALIELGSKGTNQKVINILTEKLRQIPPGEIREDARHAPQIVRQTLLTIAKKLTHDDSISTIT